MKKTIVFILLFAMVFGLALLSAGGRKEEQTPVAAEQSPIPGIVLDASRNAPEDVLVGIGMAKEASISTSIATAFNGAKKGLYDQIGYLAQNAMTDFALSEEVDNSVFIPFMENIVRTIYGSNLPGVRTVIEEVVTDGNYYVVVYLSKANVFNEFNHALNTAFQNVPAMPSSYSGILRDMFIFHLQR